MASVTRVADLRSNPSFINFDSFSVLVTSYTNITLTVYAQGFTDPEFKITGTGFDNAEISQVAESVYSSGIGGVYTKVLDKVSTYVAGTLDFTVSIREKSDPTNTVKQASDSISIELIKFRIRDMMMVQRRLERVLPYLFRIYGNYLYYLINKMIWVCRYKKSYEPLDIFLRRHNLSFI